MTGSRNRRSLLQTGGTLAVASLAGCLDGLGNDTPDGTTVHSTTTANGASNGQTTDEQTTDTEIVTSDTPLLVEGVRVQPSLLYLNTPDSMGLVSPNDQQFVFADVRPVSADTLPPTRDAFELVADGERFDGTLTPGPVNSSTMLHSPHRAYDPDVNETGWIAFEVPNPLDAESVELTYGTEERSVSEALPTDTISTLAAAPPEFELVALDAPKSVGSDELFDISVTVENVGESAATFRACLNETHPMYAPYPLVLPVPAGERREWSETFGDHAHGDTDGYSFNLQSPAEDRDIEVEVASETATTSSG